MKTVYGEYSLSISIRVQDWQKCFHEGREYLKDDLRPGQSHLVIKDALMNEVGQINRENRRYTIKDISEEVVICSDIMPRTISRTELWHVMNLGTITTNQKANDKLSSENISVPHHQRCPG
ncbi:hypothetical protein CEXT_381031 [Caerostris extrusa]|uniref:Transposase n=1 Tax=Caerostris extrusa TaxID=172846 RepID=A0AAV4SIW0_CAEEX|nr:hypothetical protein CEXT_381031 [Caerostris extrusa]